MIFAKVNITGIHATVVCKKQIPAGLIGGRVEFVFTDSRWDNLQKTVVFRGSETRDVLLEGNTAVIPAEVIAKSGVHLKVGVYGTSEDDTLAIPTLWADLGEICAAADPAADPATDPALPVWAVMQERIDKQITIDRVEKSASMDGPQILTFYLTDGKSYTLSVSDGEDGTDGADGSAIVLFTPDRVESDPEGLYRIQNLSVPAGHAVTAGDLALTQSGDLYSIEEVIPGMYFRPVFRYHILQGAVKTVNGVAPDENGNVTLMLESEDSPTVDAPATGIPVFDLGAMGLSSVTVPAGMAMLAADTAEILTALSAGAVRFVIPFTVGGNAGAFQADMHGFTDGTGAYQCVSMAMTDVPVVVMVSVSTEGLQVSVVPVASVIGLPMVSDSDNGKIMQVVDGAWSSVPVAESAVKTYVDDYISSALEGDY